MVEEMELLFTKEGMKVRMRVSMPFTGEDWHEKLISYEEIARSNRIKLTVGKIEPVIERGVLKGLKFQVTDYSESKKEDNTVEHKRSNEKGIEIQGDFIKTDSCKGILVETANWLIDKKLLNERDIPLDMGGPIRYLINTVKIHKDGTKPFKEPKKLKNGWYIETNDDCPTCEDYARRMLKKCGLSGDDLRVIGFPIV